MISEGSSCDTKDWSNEAENSALPSQNKKYHFLKCEKRFISKCTNISPIIFNLTA